MITTTELHTLTHFYSLPSLPLQADMETPRQRSFSTNDSTSSHSYLAGHSPSTPKPDLSMMRLSSSPSSTSLNASGINNANGLNASRYKTELCRPYQEYGYCKYGEKCQFAHGAHDLRSLPRHPKYKTELCRTFYSTGYCPYGSRCHFIHSKNETQGIDRSRSFPRPIIPAPPTSPSQDSGISSPDDNKMFFIGTSGSNGGGGGGGEKVFEFPIFDPSETQENYDLYEPSSHDRWSNGYSSPVDPILSETDVFPASVSSTSLSPIKPLKANNNVNVAYEETELAATLSSISLDDGVFLGAGHSRLPVFDKLNSQSSTFLDGEDGGEGSFL